LQSRLDLTDQLVRNIGQAFVKVLKNDESFLVYAVVAFAAYLSSIIVD
jgi:hypothetical protein